MTSTRLSVLAVVFLVIGGLGGCASRRETLRPVQAAYGAGDYQKAYLQAALVANTPTQPYETKQSAAYLAGLSAYRLKNLSAARDYLTFASRSKDRAVATDAKVMLARVYADESDYAQAARYYLEAAERLTGQEQANAYFFGGVAQQNLGRWAPARTSLSLAMSRSSDPGFRGRVADRLRITGYTLQTGAFTTQDNARQAAEALAGKAVALRLGAPRVVPAREPNGPPTPGGHGAPGAGTALLYLVQVGQFSSWPTAVSAREQLGVNQAVVVPLSGR